MQTVTQSLVFSPSLNAEFRHSFLIPTPTLLFRCSLHLSSFTCTQGFFFTFLQRFWLLPVGWDGWMDGWLVSWFESASIDAWQECRLIFWAPQEVKKAVATYEFQYFYILQGVLP